MTAQEDGKHLIDSNGELIPLKAQGWQ